MGLIRMSFFPFLTTELWSSSLVPSEKNEKLDLVFAFRVEPIVVNALTVIADTLLTSE